MQKHTNFLVDYFGKRAFGVCDWWGKKLGISTSRVRVYFIYFSFITLGSPVILYLIMAFFLEHKDLIMGRPRRTIWDF